ncbi:MAG: sporulation protein YabP [Firmicutes bacterium]|nr:sporulation protein YabP [Bacillota bacterium]
MEDKIKVRQHHKVIMIDREQMEIVGVEDVISFDDEQIVMETTRGILRLTGTDLHIKHLDLAATKLDVEGLISILEYTESRGLQGKGIIGRLFR